MEAQQIRKLGPALDRYLSEFDDCFSRSEPAQNLRVYVRGQLSDLPRKSIEPMADRAGVPPRTLQQFLSLAAWDEDLMAQRLAQIIARDHSHPCSIGVIDDTGVAKKGDKTACVHRQYCGSKGKVDNCVVSVHLGYVAGDFHALLAGDLFLPQAWSDDRQRCQAAGIPDDLVYRPKWHIALEQLAWAAANGVRLEWVGADAGYGEVPAFHFALDDRGQRYVLEVPSIFHGWLEPPKVLQRQHHGPRGKRLKVKNLPAIEVRNMLRYSPALRKQPWQRFRIKDTNKGPEVWEVKTATIYLPREGLPTFPHRLIVARNVLCPQEIKYWVSNAPAQTPLELLLYVAFSRYHVERCFEEEKEELGMDQAEVRNYQSLKRHLLLTAVSHLFLAKVQENWRGEKSGADDLPAPPGGCGAGAVVVAQRSGTHPVAREGSRGDHPDPATQRHGPPQPHQSTPTPSAHAWHQTLGLALLH